MQRRPTQHRDTMTIISRQKIRLALIVKLSEGKETEQAIEAVARDLGIAIEYVEEVVAECEERSAC